MTNKKCEKCGQEFECKPEDISNCQCASILLTENARKLIAANYTDCLCSNCLKKISEEQG